MNKNADAILLVEDNPDDAELTKLALSRHGLEGRVTQDRKSTRLNSSHTDISRMPSSA